MINIDEVIAECIKKRRNSKSYENYEELYGKLSWKLHEITSKLIKKENVSADIISVIVECCYALECLSKEYYPFADKEEQLTDDQVKLSVSNGLLSQILELYQNTSVEKTIQKGQPARRLVHIPKEIIHEIFSLF